MGCGDGAPRVNGPLPFLTTMRYEYGRTFSYILRDGRRNSQRQIRNGGVVYLARLTVVVGVVSLAAP